jgi:hypothetical protein
MSFQHPATFPAVPPSLSAGDHGTRDYYAAQENEIPRIPHTDPEITPYLGLRSRLSQVWINRWTILILLILVRVLIAIGGLNNDIASAKSEALAACTNVEDMGSAVASMPHYMASGVNELTANGVEKAVNGLMSMLFLTITGIEELVVFYINMLTSTYVCLITLAVSGSLHVALKVVDDVGNFLNKTLGDIGKDIHKGVDSFQADLNKFTGALNSIPQLFGDKKGAIPTLDIGAPLDKLDHVQLPGNLDQDLAKINASIPTFAQVNNFTNSAIRLPFEEVKKLINESIHVFSVNRSLFPVPKKEQLTFCTDNNGINDFFDGLGHVANVARKIFMALLIVSAILICIPMTYREIMRWRRIQKRARYVEDKSRDPIDTIYIASRPYTAGAGLTVSEKAFKGTRRQILTRWVIAYCTSEPALVVLSLGITGLLACLCQYMLLRAVRKEVPNLAHEVGDFAGKVVNTINNASAAWATDTNGVLIEVNTVINHDVLGWVNTTTGALNKTLNVFVDETTKALNETFGGTILYDPIKGVFDCLIGLKIAGIEKGLTWVSDHAHVDFPLLANNTFALDHVAGALGDKNTAFLSSPSQDTTDKITHAVAKVIKHLVDAIRTEAIISTVVFCLWVFVLLCGLTRALWLGFKRDKVRGVGGAVLPMGNAVPMTTFVSTIPRPEPLPTDAAPAYEPPREARANNFAAFTTPTLPRRAHANDDEAEWQDQKLGFAGERGPGQLNGNHARMSLYGEVEKS